ncbi:hypothetical protein BLA23254_06422 [Burkholderia lata]|uniref:Uncharacterized protein n=1 Tax=Burkholderia lata (strain ATCC 17760 / DSM 23089 / LMG 22485 / NCIMB 9086 / R18194 / 383) TaxID=482957 RepID=A0A6P2RBQ1_BURL3|nr:hypothetical protein [Burkholderia lata]VWC32248.1 hypothetical protein BLA23254_06422 [Burkholderia lata]
MMQGRTEKMRKNGSSGARLFDARFRFLLMALCCSVTFGCKAQSQAPAAAENVTPASSDYKTEIFNLVDPDGNQSGTAAGQAVSSAFDRFLGQSGLDVQMLRQRLLTGPATQGALWKMGESREWFYHICQAHQCNTTNVAMFYDEQSHRTAGRLMYRCTPQWLGNPSDAEKALIESRYPVKIDAGDVRYFCQKK